MPTGIVDLFGFGLVLVVFGLVAGLVLVVFGLVAGFFREAQDLKGTSLLCAVVWCADSMVVGVGVGVGWVWFGVVWLLGWLWFGFGCGLVAGLSLEAQDLKGTLLCAVVWCADSMVVGVGVGVGWVWFGAAWLLGWLWFGYGFGFGFVAGFFRKPRITKGHCCVPWCGVLIACCVACCVACRGRAVPWWLVLVGLGLV